MDFYNTQPMIHYLGDKTKAHALRGEGLRQMFILKQEMKLRGLTQGRRTVSNPRNGSTVDCRVCFGNTYVNVYVDPNFKEEWMPEPWVPPPAIEVPEDILIESPEIRDDEPIEVDPMENELIELPHPLQQSYEEIVTPWTPPETPLPERRDHTTEVAIWLLLRGGSTKWTYDSFFQSLPSESWHQAMDVLPDGRFVAATGYKILVQDAVGSSSWTQKGSVNRSMDCGCIKVSPNGQKIALAMGYSQNLLIIDTSVLNGSGIADITDECIENGTCIEYPTFFLSGAPYDIAWVDETYIVYSGARWDYYPKQAHNTGVYILDVTDEMASDTKIISTPVEGNGSKFASGGVAIDSKGNLFFGLGFSYSGTEYSTKCGNIYYLLASQNWQSGGVRPYTAAHLFMENVLSAGPMAFTDNDDLIIGGGQYVEDINGNGIPVKKYDPAPEVTYSNVVFKPGSDPEENYNPGKNLHQSGHAVVIEGEAIKKFMSDIENADKSPNDDIKPPSPIPHENSHVIALVFDHWQDTTVTGVVAHGSSIYTQHTKVSEDSCDHSVPGSNYNNAGSGYPIEVVKYVKKDNK